MLQLTFLKWLDIEKNVDLSYELLYILSGQGTDILPKVKA